jgi:hypothetical protein
VPQTVLSHYEITPAKAGGGGSSPSKGASAYKNQLKAIAEDFFERIDSRGKMIKIRRVHAYEEAVEGGLIYAGYTHHLGSDILSYPYSTFDLHPLSYATQHDLKARANSLAYARYKLVKREAARKAAKKKRLMLMTVVRCKAFANKLKAQVLKGRERRRREEEEARVLEARRKRILEQQRVLEKLTKENDDSVNNTSQMSNAHNNAGQNNPQPGGLIASESVGSLLTINNQANASLLIFG